MDFPDEIWRSIKSYSFDYKTYWKNNFNKSLLHFNEGRERYHLTDYQHNILSKMDNYKIVPTAIAVRGCVRYGDWMLYGKNHIIFFYGWKRYKKM
jgi:hypothetical protein